MTRGFTLVELLLSVTIISLLTGMSLPVYQSFQNRNDLQVLTEQTASALRRAQTYARGMSGDSQWGVAVQNNTVTVFKGATYAARDTAYDEAFTVSSDTTASGLTEVTFAKLSGAPSTTGNITFTAFTNDTRTITINAKGMVQY